MRGVLVDSGVWIEYLRNGRYDILDNLIQENLVLTNDVVLTELIPSLQIQKQKSVVDGLLAIKKIPLQIDWQLIQRYQRINLEKGVNKVGIPDLIILQQVIENKIPLFTLDKHFKLMQDLYNFELAQF